MFSDVWSFSLSHTDAGVLCSSVSLAVAIMLKDDYFVRGAGLPGRFKAEKVEFHWGPSNGSEGSEHSINGRRYPVEVCSVYKTYLRNEPHLRACSKSWSIVVQTWMEFSLKGLWKKPGRFTVLLWSTYVYWEWIYALRICWAVTRWTNIRGRVKPRDVLHPLFSASLTWWEPLLPPGRVRPQRYHFIYAFY